MRLRRTFHQLELRIIILIILIGGYEAAATRPSVRNESRPYGGSGITSPTYLNPEPSSLLHHEFAVADAGLGFYVRDVGAGRQVADVEGAAGVIHG